MDEEQMKQLKTDRAAEKGKVTASASRLEGTLSTQSVSKINTVYDQLYDAYHSFLDLDRMYKAALEEHEGLRERFAMVNNLDAASYTAEVTEIYTNAQHAYNTHHM